MPHQVQSDAILRDDEAFELFRALGDPTRWALVQRLATTRAAETVTEMAEACGAHLSGVSRHLAQLEKAGVVLRIKDGREVRYELHAANVAKELRRLAAVLDPAAPAQPAAPTARPRILRASAWSPMDED